MKFDKEHWKELDINVDSLWIMGPRAKGGKRANVYHGNFAPQIPDQMIRRYTEEGGIVVDIFMGSGTTLYECETLDRNFIGFDINQDIIDYVNGQMTEHKDTMKYFIHNCDVTDTPNVSKNIEADLKQLGKKTVALIMMHPPYWDIIKFSEDKRDLSNSKTLEELLNSFGEVIDNTTKVLEKNRYCAVVIGDKYANSQLIPLGFHCMNLFLERGFMMKAILVKNFDRTRGKANQAAIWRYRALASDFYIFDHEYIFIFKKVK